MNIAIQKKTKFSNAEVENPSRNFSQKKAEPQKNHLKTREVFSVFN